MFGSPILDVAVGLVFLYLLLSLIGSAVNELLETLLKNRSKDLERGLCELLQDPDGTGLVKRIYDHPLINGLFAGKYIPGKTRNLPSYIPAQTFARALLDVMGSGGIAAVPTGAGAAAAPALMVPEGVARAVALLREDTANARQNVETWFNNCMERVGGWYKRRAQMMIFSIGLAIALITNADSITVAQGLMSDGTVRNSAVAAANSYLAQNPTGALAAGTADDRLRNYLTTVSGVGLPIGWQRAAAVDSVPGRIPVDWQGWLLKLIGCLATACAVSLGAPFWFDMLNKIMTARSTIKPKENPATAAG